MCVRARETHLHTFRAVLLEGMMYERERLVLMSHLECVYGVEEVFFVEKEDEDDEENVNLNITTTSFFHASLSVGTFQLCWLLSQMNVTPTKLLQFSYMSLSLNDLDLIAFKRRSMFMQ